MPGKHLHIFDTDGLVREIPDYVLILAGNFADEIMQQQEAHRLKGGRSIILVPEPRLV